MKHVPLLLLLLGLPSAALANGYVQQNSFTLSASTIAGVDSDSVGNLYVLGLAAGTTTYGVTSYGTPNLGPQFSFNTGFSSPSAFAVEGSGIIDVLDSSSGYTLRRYTNPGTQIGQASFGFSAAGMNMVATAIDKANRRLYIAFQYTYRPFYLQCVGCPTGPSTITKTTINQYDFQGNLLLNYSMPGTDATPGSCYTPSAMGADNQGNVYVADSLCRQVVKFSPTGAVLSSMPAASWTTFFTPRGLWTDAASSLYLSVPVCTNIGCSPGIVKVGPDGSLQTSFVADSAVGCAWDGRVSYLTSAGGEPLRRFVYASAPSVPAETAPLGLTVQHSSAAVLSWQQSSDADGDPIAYSVYLGTNPAQLAPQLSAGQNSATTQPLTFGVTYYWQVVAQASYLGLPLQPIQAPVVSFNLGFTNRPPAAFVVLAGTGTVVTRSTDARLAWQPAVDPDGDPIVYQLSWSSSPARAPSVVTTAETNWTFPGLSFGSTYYWSVTARDVYGATTTLAGGSTQTYALVFQNRAPEAPVYVTTAAAYALHAASPTVAVSWLPSTDPDGDAVSYSLWVTSGAAAPTRINAGAATSAVLPTSYGASYSWQVAATDAYGAVSTGPLQTFAVSFANQPPPPPQNLSPVGAIPYHGYSPSATFNWGSSADPDGDAVSYSLYLGTDSTRLGLVASATPGYTASLAVGASYYYRIVATDVYGAPSASQVNALFYQFSDSPPSAFTVAAGSGTVSTRATGDFLGWKAANDPDGDAVSYGVFFGSSPASLPMIGNTGAAYLPIGPLAFGATYYWRVEAYDGFGSTTPMSGGVQPLVHLFADAPPAPIVYLNSTAYGVHSTSPTVTLSWSPATDPDGDTVAYQLTLGTSVGESSPMALGPATSLPVALQLETTYFWRVTASDPYGGVSTGAWQTLVAHLANRAPNPIQYLSATSVSTRAATYPVAWADSGDPDGDAVVYRFELGSASAALAAVRTSSAATFALPLQYGATAYYRVTALDSFGAAIAGDVRTLFASFLNEPPGQPNLVGAFTSSPVLRTMKNAVSVTWAQVSDPQGDPITYTVYFGQSATAMTPLATIVQASAGALSLRSMTFGPRTQVQGDGSNVTLTLSSLDYYKTYYLRVTAANPYGASASAPTQSFSLAAADGFPKAYNYPNPFSPNRGGTNIVFNAPPSGYARATVEVYSELQDLLFKQDYFNIPPGISQVRFDGRDRGGRPLFNGSYICRVRFSGPDDKEIFYLLVVK